MEDSVTSSLNLFDIIVRIVPGTLALVWARMLFNKLSLWDDVFRDGAIGLFLLFVVAYVAGTLIRGMVKPLTMLLHRLAYGANPRDCFLREPRSGVSRLMPTKDVVLHGPCTRRLGRACRMSIAKEYCDSNAPERFVLSVMINALEARGHSGKGDRMLCISDMCSSLGLVFLAGGIAILVVRENITLALLSFACSATSFVQFLRYEQIRYSTIVRTYVADTDQVREVMKSEEWARQETRRDARATFQCLTAGRHRTRRSC